MRAAEAGDIRVRSLVSAPVARIVSSVLAASNQGECTALLKRNELGSIPRLPAIQTGVFWEQRGLQTREGAFDSAPPVPLRAASRSARRQIATLVELGSIPRRHSIFGLGDVREQANPAGREPARERIDTATSPHFYESPVSTMDVQPPRKRPARVRFPSPGTIRARWSTS